MARVQPRFLLLHEGTQHYMCLAGARSEAADLVRLLLLKLLFWAGKNSRVIPSHFLVMLLDILALHGFFAFLFLSHSNLQDRAVSRQNWRLPSKVLLLEGLWDRVKTRRNSWNRKCFELCGWLAQCSTWCYIKMLLMHCMGPCNMANWDILGGRANSGKLNWFTHFYFSVILSPEFGSWNKSLKFLYMDVGTPLQYCLRGWLWSLILVCCLKSQKLFHFLEFCLQFSSLCIFYNT